MSPREQLADELRSVLEWARIEKAPLRAQEIASIERVLTRHDLAPEPRPFTAAQRRRLWDNSPLNHGDATSRAGFERLVCLIEAAHGIKGGAA